MSNTRKNEAKWIESRQRWQINVQSDGERKTFASTTSGTKGKIDAEKQADAWLDGKIRRKNIRFEELWKMFLAEIKDTTGSANYVKHEQMGRLWVLPQLRTRKLCNLSQQDYQDCINAAYKKGLSRKSCDNVRGSLTAVYRYAKHNKWQMERPEDLRIPNDAPVAERNILQPDDLKKLFQIGHIIHHKKETPSFFIYAWRFIVLTGLRRGELCGLQKADIQDDVVHIRRSINSFDEETSGKNKNAHRYFVLSDLAKQVLAEQEDMIKQAGIISPWLFPAPNGGRLDPNQLWKAWYTYRKQHGIKASLHEMRHTMISVAKADVPEQLLKKVVGHSKSMDTFGVYGHAVDGEMKRVADILDEVFGKLIE